MNKDEYKVFYAEVYRHSLAHILAKAVIEIYGKENVQYAIGPQIADGFYYDFLLPEGITAENYKTIEDKMRFWRMSISSCGAFCGSTLMMVVMPLAKNMPARVMMKG